MAEASDAQHTRVLERPLRHGEAKRSVGAGLTVTVTSICRRDHGSAEGGVTEHEGRTREGDAGVVACSDGDHKGRVCAGTQWVVLNGLGTLVGKAGHACESTTSQRTTAT